MCVCICMCVCERWCVSLTLINSFKTEHFMACWFSLPPSPSSPRLPPPPPPPTPAPFPLLAWTQRHGNSRRCSSFFSCTASWMANLIKSCFNPQLCWGAGIAQWLEHRTRDWKVAGSNPCWNGGRIFFSRVDFLCWLLFRYPFHPRVTTVARKKSRSFCQKCRWQVTAKHAYTLRMWILLNRASALVTTCP